MSKVIWQGEVSGYGPPTEPRTVRVVRVADDDCLVEELVVRADDSRILSVDRAAYSVDKDGAWAPTDDETASLAYMTALLRADRVLDRAIGMMGSREQADFAASLEGDEEFLTEPVLGTRTKT